MKIGIVCYPTYGGSGVVATELGMALSKKHQVHFFAYSQPARLDFFNENVFYHEVNISGYPLFQYPPYELALASKMVDVIRNEHLDVLHVHYAIPHASAAYMAKQILKSHGINIPVVTTLHGTDITIVGKDASYAPVVTFSINESDGVTAVSESLKNDTFELFNITNEIEVIPNFIDLVKFKKQKKEHFKTAICPSNEKLLVHTSNFRPVKRIEDVIKLFNKVRETVPSKLLLIGDGPERMPMEILCRQLGITENVRFLGKLEAVEEVLSVADVFILPSEKESFGLSALEAMACEVPVISSNTGGLPEVNIHGKTGFVSNVGDIDDMYKNTLTLLEENTHTIFKKNALEWAQTFEISKIVPLYEDFYEKIIVKSNQKFAQCISKKQTEIY